MAWGAGIFMGLFWIALIAVIVWLVVRLFPARSQGGGAVPTPQPGPESPLEILDRRLAQGEIDLETYQAHRAALIAARGGR
jgi:putative membrane protein